MVFGPHCDILGVSIFNIAEIQTELVIVLSTHCCRAYLDIHNYIC